jgi:RNA polymerase sigma factor (TIGR02999 family)
MTSRGDVTRLLDDWRRGDTDAADRVFPLVYGELRRLAASAFRRERQGHVLQPTALVHEAFLRLVVQQRARVDSRAHFLALAAKAMRRILVDHARRRHSAKRGAGVPTLTLLESAGGTDDGLAPDTLDIHRALEELALIQARQARLIELRYFGGLTMEEAADVLQVSLATVERDWTAGRLWLRRRLQTRSAGTSDD